MRSSTEEPRPSADWGTVASLLGFIVYCVSFSLPAVNGWTGRECAWMALWYWHDDRVSPLVLFGGIINPIASLYLLSSVLRAPGKVRACLAAAILFCIPMTWFALGRMDVQVKVGHFTWIAGLLLMLSPVLAEIAKLPGAKWAAVCSLAVYLWLGIPKAIGLTMHPATERDDFYYVVAWNLKEPSVCQKIDAAAIGRDDQRDDYDFTYMRSDCYRNLSALAHDPGLCGKVRSAGIDLLAGSLVAKRNCRQERYTRGTAMPADGQSFVKMMQEAGFSAKRLSELLYEPNPNNTIRGAMPSDEAYWDYLSNLATEGQTEARADFLNRVMRMK